MAEIKDRQQIILLHGAGEFTADKATELGLAKGELVVEHGSEDVKLHTLDNSGNISTFVSEKAVDAKIKAVTDAQAEKDAAQDSAITDGDAATLASAKEYADAELKKVTDAQAEKDAAQDSAITDGDAATLASAKEYTDGLSISYDSDAKEIKLMSGETQIGTVIDATDFIKDGMVSNAELVAGEGDDEGKMFIEITFNSDAESDPIRIDVSSLVDAGAIAELDARVTANTNAISGIKTAMGDWTAEAQALVDAAQNKAITDGDDATLKSAKEYADAELKKVTDAQTEKDAAQDSAITDGDAATLASAKEYADAELKKVTDAQTEKDAAQDSAITDGDAATLASAKEYADAEIENLQGQIDDIVGDTTFLKEVEVIDPNDSIDVTPSDNKVTIDFTKFVINGGEY